MHRRAAARLLAGLALAAATLGPLKPAAAAPKEVRVDFATYNPLSLLIKDSGALEKALEADGVAVRWVPSAGSNKALEFLNAGSLDLGSTAGAAALLARLNGAPIKAVHVFSRPEWTALVVKGDAVKSVADLRGRRVAVTRGTDPHIFLVRALAKANLTERDVKLVLLQHADGRLALERGDVDAWAGLDPIMASAEVEGGARLLYRDAGANTWGVLNVREAFATENPALVAKVIAVYEEARRAALADPAKLKTTLREATKLPDAVVDRWLERTDLTHGPIGAAQAETILAAGRALQEAGVIKPDADVAAAVTALIDGRFAGAGKRAGD